MERGYKGSVLVGLGRVNALARAVSIVSLTREGNCGTMVSRHSNRDRSAAVTSLTMTMGTKRVGANTPYEDSHITGCGQLVVVRGRLGG